MAELRESSVRPDDEIALPDGVSALPRLFTASASCSSANRNDPDVTVVFSVTMQGAHPYCASVELVPEQGRLLSPASLRHVGPKLLELLEEALVSAVRATNRTYGSGTFGGGTFGGVVDPATARGTIRKMMRHRIDRDFLTEVVKLHSTGRSKAVQERYGVDPRTVTRWLARAREEGLR